MGAMAGAALAAGLLTLDVAPRLQLFGICAAIAIVALVASRYVGSGEDVRIAHFARLTGRS